MSNVTEMIEERLPAGQGDLLRRASRMAAERGADLYLVGGTVRDLLTGVAPADLDLVVAGGGPDFATALAAELGGDVASRSQFGTHKLEVDGTVLDLAAARRESYQRPGALPSVEEGTLEDDLARRDFTINAMAVSLGEGSWGHLLDRHQGRRDLRERLIRVLHPDSFVDDATRLLRAIKYAHRLGFGLEEETRRLMARDLGRLDSISGDRLRQELDRMLAEPQAAGMLKSAGEMGVLGAIHPALETPSALLDRLQGSGGELPGAGVGSLLGLLVFSAPADQAPGVIQRLSLVGRSAAVVAGVVSLRDRMDELGGPDVRASRIVETLRGLDEDAVETCAIASEDPLVRERLELYLGRLRHVRPELSGDDILRLGVHQGPEVGRLLKLLLAARLDGLLSTREDEETLVRRSLEQSS